MQKTKDRTKEHEGRRTRPYRCSEGYLSVGYGRNLDTVPFSDDEILLMFENDWKRAYKKAETLPGFEELNEVRRGVLTEMTFQMGSITPFKKFIAAYLMEDWKLAAAEMLDSKWARQTPKRAKRLAHIFWTGEYD